MDKNLDFLIDELKALAFILEHTEKSGRSNNFKKYKIEESLDYLQENVIDKMREELDNA